MTADLIISPEAEEWRPIAGYEGRYEVSDQGRVRSLRFKNGRADFLRKVPKILRPCGVYPQVCLGRGKMLTIHIAVLEAFVGPCPSGMECAHRDGSHYNVRLENLRWATPVENAHDKVAHGTSPRGEGNWRAKLKTTDITRIRSLRPQMTIAAIAAEYRVTPGAIKHVLKGRNWKHV